MDVYGSFAPWEGVPHAATVMTWPTTASVGRFDINATRREIADIVKAIARYEPVNVFVNSEDPADDLPALERLLGRSDAHIVVHPTPRVDSLWARDTGPVFVRATAPADVGSGGSVQGALLNFNEWGGKTEVTRDQFTAGAVLDALGVPERPARTTLHLEGGSLEFDGAGSMLATESSVLNENRNPGWTRGAVEAEFARLFGVDKVIWLPGEYDSDDITDAHVDGVARFARPGTVLLHKPFTGDGTNSSDYEANMAVLRNATDAQGRSLTVVDLEGPDDSLTRFGDSGASEYVNYYVANGVVVLAAFGDREHDDAARRILEREFPNHKVEQVRLNEVAKQGGGIHCATQQIIASEEGGDGNDDGDS